MHHIQDGPGLTSRVRGPTRAGRPAEAGLTIIELMAALVVLGILMTLVINMSLETVANSNVKQAVLDIVDMQTLIDEYAMSTDALPSTLADVGRSGATDPWGNAYVYMRFTEFNKSQTRRDRWLVPLNSSYDLYSVGPDGATAPSLDKPVSQDDVVRANDGGYVGLGAAY